MKSGRTIRELLVASMGKARVVEEQVVALHLEGKSFLETSRAKEVSTTDEVLEQTFVSYMRDDCHGKTNMVGCSKGSGILSRATPGIGHRAIPEIQNQIEGRPVQGKFDEAGRLHVLTWREKDNDAEAVRPGWETAFLNPPTVVLSERVMQDALLHSLNAMQGALLYSLNAMQGRRSLPGGREEAINIDYGPDRPHVAVGAFKTNEKSLGSDEAELTDMINEKSLDPDHGHLADGLNPHTVARRGSIAETAGMNGEEGAKVWNGINFNPFFRRGVPATCSGSALGVIIAAAFFQEAAATNTFEDGVGSMWSEEFFGLAMLVERLGSMWLVIVQWLCHAHWSTRGLVVALAAAIIYKSIVFSNREIKAGNAKFRAAWQESVKAKQAAVARGQESPPPSR